MSWQNDLRDSVNRALRLLGPEPKSWVAPHEGVDVDVLIVGGGQGGIANAFALRRLGVTNVLVIDAAADEAHSGVWLNKARMEVLRTPKTATGPELGIPELSFQAWHEAQFGAEAFEAFEFISREDWARYLHWFREVTGTPVQYGTRLRKVEPLKKHFRAHIEVDGQPRSLVVREIILVTGIEGSGAPSRPAIITENLPSSLYSHTADDIDFSTFQGKTIAILGAGTSAFDAAAVASPIARNVHLFTRRKEIPNGGPAGPRGHAGAHENFHLIPDELRWELAVQMAESGATLPGTALKRVLPLKNVHIHLDAPFEAVREDGGKARISIKGKVRSFDHVILGTGYDYDPRLSEPLQLFADRIATWGDRYEAPKGRENAGLARYPYLGDGYEFLEKVPGSAPFLRHIHLSSKAGSTSFGRPVGDIPNLASGVKGISTSVVRNLYFADYPLYSKLILARGKPPYTCELYESRLWREPVEEAAE
jgi:cation diffusion facilitator CzcD-associated flavoprotein CzcO